MYERADQAIQTYLNSPLSVDGNNAAQQAASNLSDIATMQSPYPLVAGNWTLVSGTGANSTYKLNSIQQLEQVARAFMQSAAG